MKGLGKIYRNQIFFTVACICASLFWKSAPLSLSILFGAVVSLSNLWMLERIYRQILLGPQNKGILFASVLGKYLLLIGILGISIVYFNLHLVGLLIGLSTLIGAILWTTVFNGIYSFRA